MLEWYGRVGVNLNDVRPYIYIKVVMIAVFRRKISCWIPREL